MADAIEVTAHPSVDLVASTADISLRADGSTARHVSESPHISYFEHAQWTADGTTILASTSSNVIAGYVLPENLLEPQEEPLCLSPHSSIHLGEPSNVVAPAPYFNLSEPYTNQLLVSSRDHPIQLYYLFPPSYNGGPTPSHTPASSYPLMKARSETFLTATSLIWPTPGTHFIAGCRNMLAKFDASRTGEEPLLRIKTIPSERHLSKGGGVGMRGTVSALSSQTPDDSHGSLVAAGTWTRWVGLYDFGQAGECAAAWGIESAAKGTAGNGRDGIGGDGIMQTAWSPCGRYLLISERKSTGILVYDVRVTGQLLGWLAGRESPGNKRVSCDVFQASEGSSGFEVWSGTSNGMVKVWENVGLHEGSQEQTWMWKAHNAAVGSTGLHPTGSVIATSSGSWEFGEDDTIDIKALGSRLSETEPTAQQDENWMNRRVKDSTIKIWSLNPSGSGENIESEP
ncbi:hypothetical protein BX600DRAFT_8268 [Xylariales sp. PMI_506]|nr:hypothetical protein BX600DRAFT_8268 [Xylariales sp. PMI_506]